MTPTTFSRGPHGEIFPPPLLGGNIDPKAIVAEMMAEAIRAGSKIDIPEDQEAKDELYGRAAMFRHGKSLPRLMTRPRDATEEAIRKAVVEDGERLTLRPLGLELADLELDFAPVVQKVGVKTWRVGLEDGRHEDFEDSDPGKAIAHAQQIYVAWCDA
jgi:hypothetical protein